VQKKLTITIDHEVYEGLYEVVGPRQISRFIEDLVRPYVLYPDLDAAYAEMARDEEREGGAAEWAEGVLGDIGPWVQTLRLPARVLAITQDA
jgi:predicted CopG family antitoxin